MPGTTIHVEDSKRNLGAVTATNASYGIYLLTITGVVIAYGSPRTAPIFFLAGAFGSVIGWGLAIFLSPLDEEQEIYFTPVVKSVTAFATGYLISYLGKFLDMYLFEKEIFHLNRFVAAGIFLSCLIATWITVFLNRYTFDRPMRGYVPTLTQVIKSGLSPTQLASILGAEPEAIQFEAIAESAKPDLGPKEQDATFSLWKSKTPKGTRYIYVKFKEAKSVASFIETKSKTD